MTHNKVYKAQYEQRNTEISVLVLHTPAVFLGRRDRDAGSRTVVCLFGLQK